MQESEAKQLIRNTFESCYDENRFRRLVKEIFYDAEERDITYSVQSTIAASSGLIRSCRYLCKSFTPDLYRAEIAVLAIGVADKDKLEKFRSEQRHFIASFMETRHKDAAVVAIYTDEDHRADWRLSFARREMCCDFDSRELTETLTRVQRLTYLVGENEPCHTVQERFLPLLEKDRRHPTLAELENAFAVEKVSQEFSEKYKELYFKLVDGLKKIVGKGNRTNAVSPFRNFSTELFCKKLLGQMVFLYFIQKRGWLGMPKNKPWGSGDRRFLRTLFDDAKTKDRNYFNDFLQPLFYEALATERTQHYYDKLGCKIPFLNGGLFDPTKHHNGARTEMKIPNALFSNDEKTGILDIFDTYNFTVREDEVPEKEVAIDPEMLGKVFENLLEIRDRKSKGAFYTPREIVRYMCQESLVNYLRSKLGESVARTDLSLFIRYGDTLTEMKEKVGETKSSALVLPAGIKEYATKIDKALADVKICDPAIGSGAFPIGLMHEIVRARLALLNAGLIEKKKHRSAYEYKRHAIQNSLYGVDIDESAVEIAKLRLWLSLIVDEENSDAIKPLPNLDGNIVCGNSLFGENGGFDIVIGNPPYVSTKGISAEDKKTLRDHYGFADDTYTHFFFKGIQLLKNNGGLTYITPKTFWTTQTKRNLRNLLLSQTILYIFDTANPFEAAMVDTCVTSVQNVKTENNQLKFLDGSKNLSGPRRYSIEQSVYLNTQNSVIFKPTPENLQIYESYGQKVKDLYEKWWDKISSSKNIEKHKVELEAYRKSLKPGDIALLGCLTEGGQGLATGNNGKYLAVRQSTKWAKNILESRPKKLAAVIKEHGIRIAGMARFDNTSEYLASLSERKIATLFDDLKEKYGRDIFGQGYLYRLIDDGEMADVDSLTEDEKQNGISENKKYYVPYDKGDKDGNRWYLETPFAIAWTQKNVELLKTDPKARYQGYAFYFREGFCWSDINTTFLKCRKKQKSINDVKSMSLYSLTDRVPECYMICLINSSFMSHYVDDFVNNTQTFQINDARRLPILIPTHEQLAEFAVLFNAAIDNKRHASSNESQLAEIQSQLDKMVVALYETQTVHYQ